MKIDPDPEKQESLLDAVLRDESWVATSAGFKAEAMLAFRARQRLRRITRWAGCMMTLAAGVLCAMHWLGYSLPSSQRQVIVKKLEAAKEPGHMQFLTDEELLASFPKASCILAEIDGKKELVFLDANLERTYVAEAR